MRHIGKSFSGVRVLEDVQFDVRAGEVHVLAGENGAGKSTLMRILTGALPDYEGEILLEGRPVHFATPHEAFRRGLGIIHQELSLIPSLSVLDNIFLGREGAATCWLNRAGEARRVRDVLARLGLDVDLQRAVEEFPLATQQLIELAKALVFEVRLLVMDEPTSALPAPDVERLLRVVQDLKARGCGIVYITHRMEEVYRVADRITVLRDGRRVGTESAAALGRDQLVEWMIGRALREQYPEPASVAGPVRLQVQDFRVAGGRGVAVDQVSFSVRSGEIVGLAGLEGSGRSELLQGLFGGLDRRAVTGAVSVEGRPVRVACPAEAMRAGLALLTSDRKTTGLVLTLDAEANLTLCSLARYARGGWRQRDAEAAAAERQVRQLGIRGVMRGPEVATLSGGNQQKVALGKWLETQPRVLLLDEPTRGIDVGAKQEIYRLMEQWKRQGLALLLVTSEMPELLAMADRVLVLHRGRLVRELSRREATPERVVRAAMGEEAA
jgi:ribose transport system ATP-binding protein